MSVSPRCVVTGAASGIGLAAAIKLTPALFVIFLFLLGRKRPAWTAIISFGRIRRPRRRQGRQFPSRLRSVGRFPKGTGEPT